MTHISQLAIYPIKSCAQVRVDNAHVDSFGLYMDRRWMVIDEKGHFITQRDIPMMCLINPTLSDNGLLLNAPDMQSCIVKIQDQNEMRLVSVWLDQCQAIDCGDEAANWLTTYLKTKCRLVFFPEDEVRQVDLNYANQGDKAAFSDGFPFLLISEASLEDLNQRIKQSTDNIAIEMRRFRPNIVVAGCDAFSEDSWKKVQIGDMLLRVVKPCSRCVIPSIDPDTGIRGDEPLNTLKEYRKKDKKIFFGQNVIAESVGRLEVGMPITILE